MWRYFWLLVILLIIYLLTPFLLLLFWWPYQTVSVTLPSVIFTNHQIDKALPITTEVSFIAVGDVSLSRNVAAQIKKYHDPLFPFKQLDAVLKSTDFNTANLESPFSGESYFGQTGSLVFNAPLENSQGLVDYNFKVLNIANNHTLDQGLVGLINTINHLSNQGLQTFGAGQNLDQAWQPAIIEVRGVKIGFLGASYASVNDNGKSINSYVARIEDEDKLKTALSNLKSQVDFVVVNMHAGTEYTSKPNSSQIKFAHTAIDYGADLVIGHHPHWIQTVEQYQGKYIFYSLGNFIFDQMWSQQTREGLMLKIKVEKKDQMVKIKQIELLPVIIENYSTPRLADQKENEAILKKIGLIQNIITF